VKRSRIGPSSNSLEPTWPARIAQFMRY
jgi:hypothetical protein